MKIVFCLGSLNRGGAERVVCNLANYFAKLGNEVALVITKDCERKYSLDRAVDVWILDDNISGKRIRNLRRIRRLHSIFKEIKPDLVFGFLQEPIARLLATKLLYSDVRKVPVIVSVRIDPRSAFNNIKRRVSLPLYNLADGFVFQTEEAKKFFNESIQERSVVIGNSVDKRFFAKNDSIRRKKKIVSVGRLVEQKNYPMLIEAFSGLGEEFKDWSLEVYGDGPLKKELLRYVEELGLSDRILFKGETDNVDEKLKEAGLFVITSDYEGMSNALMEAMALGVPCISTNSAGGGAATLIENEVNGVLVPVGDAKALCEQIKKLLNDDKMLRNMSKRAAQSMRRYSPDVVNQEWLGYARKVTRLKRKGAK